jgi:hypothetical protein
LLSQNATCTATGRETREREEKEALESLRKEQEAKENEEFDKWKNMFTVGLYKLNPVDPQLETVRSTISAACV